MWDCDCGAVPVLDGDGRLAGIIIVRASNGAAARNERLDRLDRVQSQEVTATLADICQPRANTGAGLHA
jgi:hypothetical protein